MPPKKTRPATMGELDAFWYGLPDHPEPRETAFTIPGSKTSWQKWCDTPETQFLLKEVKERANIAQVEMCGEGAARDRAVGRFQMAQEVFFMVKDIITELDRSKERDETHVESE